MSGLQEALWDANQVVVDFLLADLDLAMTFMDIAQVSQFQETIRRNHDNARKAYDTVVHLLQKLAPNAGQRHELEAKLVLVRTRLHNVEQQF